MISVARNVVHMPCRLSVSSTPIQRTLLWEGDARALAKSGSVGGQMPPDVAQEIHTVIMSNCIPEAVILARELRLPPPVPIPQVNVQQPPAKPAKGRSPEIA